MKEYLTEEFLCKNPAPSTFEDEVEKKISLLYDFCILVRNIKSPRDKREKEVRKMLLSCKTETAMSNVVHDVLKGTCTLNEVLKKYTSEEGV